MPFNEEQGLTREDVQEAVHDAMAEYHSCHTFSPEEVVMIKRRLKTIDKVANTIGYFIIGAVMVGVAALAAIGGLIRFGGK